MVRSVYAAPFDVAETENSIYRGTALRGDLVFLALSPAALVRRHELGYDRAWLTYIKNSDWYRTYFYADAKDGWYGGTGGLLHAGAKGGVTLGRVEVSLRAGVNRSESLNDSRPAVLRDAGCGPALLTSASDA